MLVKRKRRSPTKPVTRELAVYSGQTFLGAVKLGAKATAYDSHNTRIGESPCALGISGGGNALWAACGSEPLEKLFTVCMPSRIACKASLGIRCRKGDERRDSATPMGQRLRNSKQERFARGGPVRFLHGHDPSESLVTLPADRAGAVVQSSLRCGRGSGRHRRSRNDGGEYLDGFGIDGASTHCYASGVRQRQSG
jgi:hypothetical protein